MYMYLESIKTATLIFPFIALVFTLPFLLFQYKKYGYINKIKLIVSYSLLFFFINAYFLVILPLPEMHHVEKLRKPLIEYMQLIPFTFIADILRETKVQLNLPSTYLNLLRERALLQVFFNAILLMPLGIYLRYYFKKNLIKTILITFSISLFFEITQITGLYGMYKIPYRVFDVDDLMLNTFGGIIGYLLIPKVVYFFANHDIGINFKKWIVRIELKDRIEEVDLKKISMRINL